MTNYIIDRYFSLNRNEETCSLSITANWKYIESLPEFAVLKETPQSPKWHSEGPFVIDHVKRCVELAMSYFSDPAHSEDFTDDAICTVLMAVLFHDIGKGAVTVLGEDGLYHNPNHAIVGEKITRKMLWDLGYHKREYICKLVRHHMHPLDVVKTNNWFERMYDLACRCGGLRELTLVKTFDLLGSVPTVPGVKEDNQKSLIKFMLLAQDMDIYTRKPSVGPNTRMVPYESKDDVITVYVLMGLPGAGRSTFVSEHLFGDNYALISRDEIRHELGYCNKGEKIIGNKEQEKLVTELFNKKMLEAAQQGKILILDNMNNRREYRDTYKKLLKDYATCWKYVYCEAPTLDVNILRRHGQIDGSLFAAMIDRFDMPTYDEYDSLTINISRV